MCLMLRERCTSTSDRYNVYQAVEFKFILEPSGRQIGQLHIAINKLKIGGTCKYRYPFQTNSKNDSKRFKFYFKRVHLRRLRCMFLNSFGAFALILSVRRCHTANRHVSLLWLNIAKNVQRGLDCLHYTHVQYHLLRSLKLT